MSYVNQTIDPGRRATAIAGVAAIHAGIAALIVTGLTITGYIQNEERKIEATNIPLPPPPPDPTPTPEPTHSATAQAPTPPAPMPPLPLPPQPGPVRDIFDDQAPLVTEVPRTIGTVGPVPIPPPPSPTPSFSPTAPAPLNGPAGWITTQDYPAAPLRRGIEGTSAYRLVVGSNGRVSECEVTGPSGNRQLDRATCSLIERRARFDPAIDASGAKVVGTFTGTVRWQIPD